MTTIEYRAAFDAIGWSHGHLAERLAMSERQVRRWYAGDPVPTRVGEWLDLLARHHAANPPPRRIS